MLEVLQLRSTPKGLQDAHDLLASDGGFAYTALLGTNARRVEASRIQHRNWATASASVALVSYLMMLKPFRRD